MRYFVVVLIFILFGCENRKELKKGELEIIPKYCKYNNISIFHFPKRNVKLFKKGNLNEIKILEKNWSNFKHSAKISNLDYGDYYIEYISTYNQKNIIQFHVNHPKEHVEFCADYINYNENKNLLLIDDFENGEKIILEFSNTGCFDGDETPEILKLSKFKNKISANYRGKDYNLSASQISLFREFETELHCNHSYGCTTVDKYVITRLGKRIDSYAFTDGSCEWRGFYHLLDTLKIKQ